MANIYELAADFLKVQELIEEGELDHEMLLNTLECLDYEIEEKAEGYAKIIKNLTAEVNGLKAEEERLSNKRKAIENNIDSLKRNLEEAMILTGKRKFKTDLFSFNIQKNPPSVKILDETKIPEEFRIPQPDKIDNKGILHQLKNGATFDFAEITQGESLRIR